jgi:hypothetical protein
MVEHAKGPYQYAKAMADERWRPLSARESSEAADEALFEGVPKHLVQPLREWLASNTKKRSRLRIAAMTRTIGLPSDDYDYEEWMREDSPKSALLDLVDALLHVGPESDAYRYSAEDAIDLIAAILVDGGSVYGVNDDRSGLQRRVAEETVQAATHAMDVASITRPSAAKHLRGAWQAAFGLHPTPPLAYSEAVKAVEAALIPVVQPNHARATLGTVLGELRANAARWGIAIEHGPNHAGDVTPLIVMAETLWTGQTDRHAANGPTRAVSQKAAEGAVFLAVTVVQLVEGGILRRE